MAKVYNRVGRLIQTRLGYQICVKCNKEKSFSEYSENIKGYFGFNFRCIECTLERAKESYYKNQGATRKKRLLKDKPGVYDKYGRLVQTIEGHKICKMCNTEKPFDQFDKRSIGTFNLAVNCKPCALIRRREIYQRNADHYRRVSREWHHNNKEKSCKMHRDWSSRQSSTLSDSYISNAVKRRVVSDLEVPPEIIEVARKLLLLNKVIYRK